jgi:UDP-N-acetylmuramate dehydrogenase
MEKILQDLHITYESQVPLAPLTWYGVGGPARVVAHPSSVSQLSALAARGNDTGTPLYVLGAGANLLVRDEGVDGIVVRLDSPQFQQLTIGRGIVHVGAGYDLAKLVLETAKAGWSGLECLAGVPATVGGAVRMNAGGAFGDIGRSVARVQAMGASGQVYARDRADLVFAYRSTNLSAKFITEVQLELTPGKPEEIRAEVQRVFTLKSNSQPLGAHCAGCAFKNPPAQAGASAGQLLDRAGLKGFTIGGAQVSPVHANFIIARRDAGCTARDILAVMEHAQQVVAEKFGVHLEREVVLWP